MPIAWIVSVVLAVQVLGKSKYSHGHGKGMAVAALIIVPLWIVVIIALVALDATNDAERDTAGAVTQSGDVPSRDLRQGDCVADKDLVGDSIITVKVTPCDKPHFFETYATFTMPDGDYPGDADVIRFAEGGCIARYEKFVGLPFEESTLGMTYLYPLESSWSLEKDVSCMITQGSSVSETLEGANR
jgi:hypothetical protein